MQPQARPRCHPSLELRPPVPCLRVAAARRHPVHMSSAQYTCPAAGGPWSRRPSPPQPLRRKLCVGRLEARLLCYELGARRPARRLCSRLRALLRRSAMAPAGALGMFSLQALPRFASSAASPPDAKFRDALVDATSMPVGARWGPLEVPIRPPRQALSACLSRRPALSPRRSPPAQVPALQVQHSAGTPAARGTWPALTACFSARTCGGPGNARARLFREIRQSRQLFLRRARPNKGRRDRSGARCASNDKCSIQRAPPAARGTWPALTACFSAKM
jgi:hypothetical protein